MLTLILFTIIIILVLTYCRVIFQRQQYFKLLNISGPKSEFFFGHLRQIWNVKVYSRKLQEWTKQYGKIYGIFEGTLPIYVVSNLDFIEQVFIKQFSNFNTRKSVIITSISKGRSTHLVSAVGRTWKRQRSIINQTFSAIKLKQMSPLMIDCVNELMKNVKNEEFNIYTLYKRMALDVICRCAFGIDTNMQNEPDNIYLKKIDKMFSPDILKSPLVKLYLLLPELSSLFINIFLYQNRIRGIINKFLPTRYKLEKMPFVWILDQIHDIIKMRLKTEKQRIDLLKFMLDLATHEDIKEQADNGINQSIPKQLAYGEVQHNVFFFMVAGYETTAVTLAYCTYVLANYPKVQEKLQEEIDHHYHKENDNYSDYYIISNMEYMELFIKEVLRMFPVAISQTTNRQCVRETTVCGYQIAKGIIVQADVYSIHYDQELWGPENVNDFCPERHLIKRHPLAWLAFGAGPRICVGMRFALIEIKLLLMNLLKEYTIIKCEKLEKNFNVIETITIAPEEVWIKLEKRY
ncbi:unnamed protein product [Didymodactylos carnosus]|uniref:Cytochrome P450 n=1 Tax=Didymodactylos carnosus TaxID=1234261 RepID=A0A815JED5_9BILA|nr:unnamed protein product [Didymodactylos carnosus]CAF4270972.1 unnamed protein product [Didymodactylos carnosus]